MQDKKDKHVETVGEYADRTLWAETHKLRAPKPVSTRIMDITGNGDSEWKSMLGRLQLK